MTKTAVLISGGMDSIVLAHFLRNQHHNVYGCFIDFGQPAARPERAAAEKMCVGMGIPLTEISVVGPNKFSEGEIVGRNAFLLLSALTHAPTPLDFLAIGIHSGTPYYDCSRAFIERLDQLVGELTSGATRAIAPFVSLDKRQIAAYADLEEIDLQHSYSCEVGSTPACGACRSCKDRAAL